MGSISEQGDHIAVQRKYTKLCWAAIGDNHSCLAYDKLEMVINHNDMSD